VRPITPDAYRQLAEFRFQIRSFLHFSENAGRLAGIEPQQHQLMLAIKGLPAGARPTVTALAQRLCLKHHSTVELINRLERRGVVVRRPSNQDKREVLIELTDHGENLLDQLSVLHWRELQSLAPKLTLALEAILHNSPEKMSKIR
jgi:DNA-binding MarR family transcriptional regulator